MESRNVFFVARLAGRYRDDIESYQKGVGVNGTPLNITRILYSFRCRDPENPIIFHWHPG